MGGADRVVSIDCTCREVGLCGACTPEPSHTESKALADLRLHYGPLPASDIAADLSELLAKAELASQQGDGAKMIRINREADRVHDVLNERRGRNPAKSSGGSFGRHAPTPRQNDRPLFDPTRRK